MELESAKNIAPELQNLEKLFKEKQNSLAMIESEKDGKEVFIFVLNSLKFFFVG